MTPAKFGFLLIAAGFTLLATWSILIEPRWLAERHLELKVSEWPMSLKVVIASDWHLTQNALWRVTTPERAEQIIKSINQARPDVILLPGDFIADYTSQNPSLQPEDEIAALLGELRAKYGVYAVLGNHDWWHNGPAFKAALEKKGITVLENTAVPLPIYSNDKTQFEARSGHLSPATNPYPPNTTSSLNHHEVWVVGIGDDETGHSDPDLALQDLPKDAKVLLMMHDPANLEQLPPLQGLIVAGHTHGGQVQIPGWGAPIISGRAPRQWSYGWIETPNNHAYVTSGIGVSVLPIRFNMRPEWVVFNIAAP